MLELLETLVNGVGRLEAVAISKDWSSEEVLYVLVATTSLVVRSEDDVTCRVQ